MKNLLILSSLAFSLFLAACSDSGEGITSPVSPDLEKSGTSVQPFPFELYQTFPEFSSSIVKWKNYQDGIVIAVSDRSAGVTSKNLFGVIDDANSGSSKMVYLGESSLGNYYLKGFDEKDIRSIRVYYTDINSSATNYLLPYPKSQLFNNVEIKSWSDEGVSIRINSYSGTSASRQVFAQLITTEGNQIIFLGNPQTSTFEFPKPGKFNLRDIKLFSYR